MEEDQQVSYHVDFRRRAAVESGCAYGAAVEHAEESAVEPL